MSIDAYKYPLPIENPHVQNQKQTQVMPEQKSILDKENREPNDNNNYSSHLSEQRVSTKQEKQSKEHVSKIPVRKSDDKRTKKSAIFLFFLITLFLGLA